MEGVDVVSRFFCLAGLVLTIASCTLTKYEESPPGTFQPGARTTKDFPIHYHVTPFSYYKQPFYVERGDFFSSHPPELEEYEALQRVFEENRHFSRVVATQTAPAQGIYCSVDVEYIPPSQPGAFFLSLSYASAAILPSYSGSSRYIVTYHLYVDRDFKKGYEYTISIKRAVWAAFMPLAWVNVLTPDLDDAFRATANQFFLDAERDGYLSQAQSQ